MTRNEKNLKDLKDELQNMNQEREDWLNKLLAAELLIGIFACMLVIVFAYIGSLLFPFSWVIGGGCYLVGFAVFYFGISFAMEIQRTVGYYKCQECGHCHVPTKMQYLWAPHFASIRRMKCPKCSKKSWQRKAYTKD